MTDKKEVSGILISDAEGNLYNIPEGELRKFLVPKDKVEEVMVEAEGAGLEAPEPVEPEMPSQPIHAGGSVINIFIGGALPESHADEVEDPQGLRMRSTMAKYAGGSTMAKYAGGSTMAKYAGGSTMAKYAGGSTMAKYAGGSTMVVARYGPKRGR